MYLPRIHLRVPPQRVEELLDRIWQVCESRGTLEVLDLIDEYREDVYIELPQRRHKEKHP